MLLQSDGRRAVAFQAFIAAVELHDAVPFPDYYAAVARYARRPTRPLSCVNLGENNKTHIARPGKVQGKGYGAL